MLISGSAGVTRAADDDPPLKLARDGFFYVGSKPCAGDRGFQQTAVPQPRRASRGNSHVMMQKKNNKEIAAVIEQ
jgi:hypothetical protein